jgi:hypothetical protein
MGVLIDELGKPRWGGGGLMLLVLLSLLFVPPLLRNQETSHPLSAAQRIDLCALLPEPPSALRSATRVGRHVDGGGSTCDFTDDDHVVEMSVGLITTREASFGAPQRTSAMYAIWLKETVASGATDVHERAGDWAMASSYRAGQSNQVLAEDHGVLLTLSSTRISADALTTYARAITTALRKPRT